MLTKEIMNVYSHWLAKADNTAVEAALRSMDEAEIEDSFYKDLAFGTGGLRGVIGAGTNRMNIYTVARASSGLADYVVKSFDPSRRRIAVSYDSRINSDLFARTAAQVFAASGLQVFIYPELMPTPLLSYAVRNLNCAAGIMVTASHNPAKYNGYKVYGPDGCQITDNAAGLILNSINSSDYFDAMPSASFEDGLNSGHISYITDDIAESFNRTILSQSVLFGDDADRDVSIVYSPLNGTGLKPVLRVLDSAGFSNVTVVEEQRNPDGNFPTCPFPNPEITEAMRLGLSYCDRIGADLLIATDPDCDRVGIAVRSKSSECRLLTGNETGMLLLDYICSQRQRHDRMPESPVYVKTIVTSDLLEHIASNYGVRTVNVLTGFKYIGEQIGRLESESRESSYIFGCEESYGYLSGSYVRDKDAVDAVFLICEMFAFYKSRNISLLDKLEELYRKYGYMLNSLTTYEFDGSEGAEKMQSIMQSIRETDRIGSHRITHMDDYINGKDGLPPSNVIKFRLDDNITVVVRPSGTEPKIKIYISALADTREIAAEMICKTNETLKPYFS